MSTSIPRYAALAGGLLAAALACAQSDTTNPSATTPARQDGLTPAQRAQQSPTNAANQNDMPHRTDPNDRQLRTARTHPTHGDFSTLDHNRDGMLSAAEFAASGLLVSECDTNSDGQISQEEYASCINKQ